MRVRKCDSCGKIYKDYEGTGKYSANGIMFIEVGWDDEYTEGAYFDLCKECMTKAESLIQDGMVGE